MNWFGSKKRKEEDESRKKLLDATHERKEVLDRVMERLNKCTPERRKNDENFDGPNRRIAHA